MNENKAKIALLKDILSDYYEWSAANQREADENTYLHGVVAAIGSVVFSDSIDKESEV